MTVIHSKGETTPDQVLDHAKATLRAIYRLAGLSECQPFVFMNALGQILAMRFQPPPVVPAADPVAVTNAALQGRQLGFQLGRNQFGCLADWAVHGISSECCI